MQDLIETMISSLTAEKVTVILDDEIDCLGQTYANPASYIIEINVKAHTETYGEDALEQLHDTIRHEVAHVEHIASLHKKISDAALEEYTSNIITAQTHNFQPLSYEFFFQSVKRGLLRGKDSHHGPTWKKFAKKLGAEPRA